MFFLRRYTTGKAKSGTTDITSWDEFPPYEEFRAVCESFGAGKYIMFQRGKGIRGMRKTLLKNKHLPCLLHLLTQKIQID